MASYTFITQQTRAEGEYTSATVLLPANPRTITANVVSTTFIAGLTLTLYVDVSNDGGSTWQTIFSVVWLGGTSGRTSGWSGACDLSAYGGMRARVRMVLEGGSLSFGLSGEIV